ncbi:hypothetical protein ACRASX_02110 [Flavobacterium sp. TMP13]|uniref:hypothetical protein n=1 Tax=Flavobacterium sp. TMP13 TaxID=3425950 RepID=UPI003D76AAAC
MKQKSIKTVLSILILILVLSCKNEDSNDNQKNKEEIITPEKKSSNNYNISILLDLSDRISTEKYPNSTMEFYQRDLGYINSIATAFTNHIKTKKIREMNDKIAVYFNPEPLNEEINSISGKLKFVFDKNNASKNNINRVNVTYNDETAKIYDLAIKDNNYVGSDIWKFFANNVNDYCIENKHRNILILLTDGYIFYKDTKIKEDNLTSYLVPEMIRANGLNTPNWKDKIEKNKFGLISANEDLSDLEILVLGVNPDTKNPYEAKVIKEYWGNWFKKMKVKRFVIKESGLPSNIDKVIKDFIEQY